MIDKLPQHGKVEAPYRSDRWVGRVFNDQSCMVRAMDNLEIPVILDGELWIGRSHSRQQ